MANPAPVPPAADSETTFRGCMSRADNYPESLTSIGPNTGSLHAHKLRLDEKAPDVFYHRSTVHVVEFDADPNQPAMCRQVRETLPANAQGMVTVDDWLVVPPPVAPPARPATPTSTRCRFIFFESPSTESKLDVSRPTAARILTYFQVMASFVDFITMFAVKGSSGRQVEPVELRFSGFRERILLARPARALALPSLGLGGRNYQLCYSLKRMNLRRQAAKQEDFLWSARHSAVHHQFDIEKGVTVWVVASARDELRGRIKQLTGANGNADFRQEDRCFASAEESFISSLAVHLVLAQWATEDWRGYIRWLEQVLEEKTAKFLQASDFEPDADNFLFVQKKEDDTNKAMMMLDANVSILESIHSFYQGLMDVNNPNTNFDPLRHSSACRDALADFALQMREFTHDFRMHGARARTLAKITADRKDLVQQKLQAHTNSVMESLTIQSQREAVNMRIISVLGFLLLPATFVSTFFSTDVVKYQKDDGPGAGGDGGQGPRESYSPLAMERWVEVALPMTVLTFAAAYMMVYWERVRRWTRLLACTK